MERLMRLRQPAVVVALLALALHAGLSAVSTVRTELPDGSEPSFAAAGLIEPVLLLLLTAVVVTCWLGEPTRSARALTVVALMLTALLTATVLILGIAAVLSMPWEEQEGLEVLHYGWLLPPLTVAATSLMVQVTLLRRPVSPPAPQPDAGAIPPELWPEPVEEETQNLEPGWAPEAAVGTVWRRAGDATSAQPTTEWDAPGQSTDWGRSEPEAGPSPETPRRVEP